MISSHVLERWLRGSGLFQAGVHDDVDELSLSLLRRYFKDIRVFFSRFFFFFCQNILIACGE